MKNKTIKFVLAVLVIMLLGFGFSEGMEWYRLIACLAGGSLLGVILSIDD